MTEPAAHGISHSRRTGAAEYLRGLDAVTPKCVGVVGFCMGGQLAFFAAAEHPDVIDACVDFSGIHPNVHPPVGHLRAPVLGHFGREDTSVPLDRVEALFADLRARGAHLRPRPKAAPPGVTR